MKREDFSKLYLESKISLCSIFDPILLAKSLQGDNRKPYSALWLSLSGQKSCFRPVWRHDASRFSRGSSAPANSPAVSGRFRGAGGAGTGKLVRRAGRFLATIP